MVDQSFKDRFEDFMRRTERDAQKLDGKIDHVTTRVDALWGWRLKMTGIWAGVSGLVSVVVTLLTLYFHAK